MKNNKNKAISLLLTLFTAACGAPLSHAAYEDVGVGARVTGLGNAFTALADDVYAVYYNPAGLGTLDRPMLATTYSRLLTGLSDNSKLQNSFVAYARPIQHGRQGAWGMAWNYFTLDDLYKEMSLYGSYGRQLFAQQLPNGFYGGLTLKFLNRSLGSGTSDAAGNAFGDTGQRLWVVDPVLQRGSKSNLDLDLGLLYRVRPKISVGLAVVHLFEPNIAFSDSDTDRLGRNVKLGAAYQTSWTSFTGDLQFLKAPDRSTDKVFTMAAEKWLPTLMHGTFGIRGSVGLGSRQYRQMTAGLSYKIYKMQVDYGFAIPLGTISSTFGTHRLGMSFRFGRPSRVQPIVAEAILENLRELSAVGTPEFRAQAEAVALYKRTAQREFLRQARLDMSEGRFADSRAKLEQALALNPKDKGITESLDRMGTVVSVFPEIVNFRTDAAEAAVYEAMMEYVAGKKPVALRKLAYAASIAPTDERIEDMLQIVERETGIKVDIPTVVAAPTAGREKLVAARLALMEVAMRGGEYRRVLKLAEEVIELDPRNALAHKRKAAAFYARKDYPRALKALSLAYKYETQPESRRRLKSYIDALKKLIARAQEKPSRRRAKKRRAKASPYEVQRMYEAGVDLYVQGRLSDAASMFRKILESNPENPSARRALDRIEAEILRGRR